MVQRNGGAEDCSDAPPVRSWIGCREYDRSFRGTYGDQRCFSVYEKSSTCIKAEHRAWSDREQTIWLNRDTTNLYWNANIT